MKMKWFAVLLACFTMNAIAQTLPSEKVKYSVTQEGELQYLYYLPKDYKADGAQRWPLVLFLHGAGERGSDVQRVGVHGPMKLVKAGTNFPFIVVAPQCPAGERWKAEALVYLLDNVTTKYAVDTNRVYLTGLSMGGYGTWDLGIKHMNRFAAIAPICGGGQTIDAILAGFGKTPNPLVNYPVWAFHGAKDNVVKLEESERMVNALKNAGAQNVKLTVYPEAGHDSWTETYNNPEFFSWLLSHNLAERTKK